MPNKTKTPYTREALSQVEGVPVFIEPSQLGALEKQTQSDYDVVAEQFYDNAVDWLFQSFYEDEDKVRDGMIDSLALTPSSCVLEIGCGTGRDSFRIAKRLSDQGIFFMQDLSPKMVLKTKKTMAEHRNKSGFKCSEHYFISDAVNLPFPDGFFDAVFHFGGFNNFSNPKSSLKEFARITRKGGKVVVGDESVPPWLEGTEFAEIVCVNNPLFRHKAPLHTLPECARDVTVRWVLGSCFYVIDFRVDEGAPKLNLDLPHQGRRGGTLRTRYFGQLEGVSLEAKKLASDTAAKEGISVSDWLDKMIRKTGKK